MTPHIDRNQHEKHTQDGHDGHGNGHSGGMHAGHERMFKRRFVVSLVLSIPVLLYSEGFQALVGFSVPTFPGSEWLSPLFAVVVFGYGGVPFLEMAVPIARAIRDATDERGLSLPTTRGFEASNGRGVQATVDGNTVHVGGPNLLEQLAVEPAPDLGAFAEGCRFPDH